jgi:hypothetical protein
MKLHRVFVAATLAAALAMPVTSFAKPQDRDDKKEMQEKHPEIREAIRQLEQTKDDLEHKAASDFHGHKTAAIKSINEAIHHLREALESDKH